MSNARDTTNFTTTYLQTDVASYVESTISAIKNLKHNSTLTI